MAEIKNITVIGGTGMLGKPVVKALAKAGFAVTLLVRNKSRAERAFGSPVKYVQGSLEIKADIERALQGADAVYINLSVHPSSKAKDFQPERDGLRTLLEVAKAQLNIKHIGYLSSTSQFYTAHGHWVLQLKRDAVKQIKQSGIPYTIFYPSIFMESLPHKQMQGNKLLTAGSSPVKLWWIAAADYAKQVSKAFSLNPAQSREYFIQGPQGLTMDEGVNIFAKIYPHKRLRVMKAPLWAIKLGGLFNREANYGYQIMDSIIHYPEKFEAQKTWEELGKPEITLDKYTVSL